MSMENDSFLHSDVEAKDQKFLFQPTHTKPTTLLDVDDTTILKYGRDILLKEALALKNQATQHMDLSFSKIAKILYQTHLNKGKIIVTGMGKSALASKKWVATLNGTGISALFLDPAHALHGDLGVVGALDTLIGLSLSGETEELIQVFEFAQKIPIPRIAVTKNKKSTLSLLSDIHLMVAMDDGEACPLGLSPTTSSTLMTALGDALSGTLIHMRQFLKEDFSKLHPGGHLGKLHHSTVGMLMHRGEDLPFVPRESTLQETLLIMTEKRLGAAIVISKKGSRTPIGIITDGDIRRYFNQSLKNNALPSLLADTTKAEDLMTSPAQMIDEHALLLEALTQMKENKIQQLIVIQKDSGYVVGVLHIQDLIRYKIV